MLPSSLRLVVPLGLASLVALTGCAAEVGAHAVDLDSPDAPTHERIDPFVTRSLARGETIAALVVLDASALEDPSLHLDVGALARLALRGDVVFDARVLPLVATRLRTIDDLDSLASEPSVRRVEAVRYLARAEIPSLSQIGQPTALTRGATGAGLAVAVFDTGADPSATELGACPVGPGCGVVAALDFAPDDGVADDEVRHGTNVASIVRLVAPSVSIVALDVFDGDLASSLDIARAADWALANRDVYHIVAANLSLGYGTFSAPCPDLGLSMVMQSLRDGGIAPVVAAGNDAASDAISAPACAPAALSVAAVDASDTLASFSNVASFVTLAAPGVAIHAGGVWMSGTSQATPHVSGAFAALSSLRPGETIDALEARFVERSALLPDARSGLELHRLALDLASEPDAVPEPTPTPEPTPEPTPTPEPPTDDIYPPSGAFDLAGGAATTSSRAIEVAIRAFDLSGLDTMCLSTSSTCTSWVRFSTHATLTAPGAGVLVARLWLRDRVGNTTPTPITRTITVLR